MSVPMNQLRAFYWVARLQSLSRAAQQLNISQPSLSKQLQRLEQSYQILLFDRGRRGMRLTSHGQALYQQVQGLGRIEENADVVLNQLQHTQQQKLRIGIGSVQLLMPLIGQFHQQHSDIELDVVVAGSQDLQQQLQELEFDIGIFHASKLPDDFRRLQLCQQHLELMVAADHPLSQQSHVDSWQLLTRYPFIFRSDGSLTQSLVNQWLSHNQIELKPLLSFNSQESQREAVAAQMGIAFVFSDETPPDSRLTTISLQPLTPPQFVQSILWPSFLSNNPALKQFVEFMLQRCQHSGLQPICE